MILTKTPIRAPAHNCLIVFRRPDHLYTEVPNPGGSGEIMPTIPWRTFSSADPDREYHIMASQLPLKSMWQVPSFLRLTLAVRGQLAKTDGLVGYSLIAELTHKRFWTLSAWTDEQHLATFAGSMPHLDVMRRLRPHVAPTTFVTWKVSGKDVPVSWEMARAHLAAPTT
jgi:hypothetical protein